jgi:Fe-S cluster biogenesis protein NfuA
VDAEPGQSDGTEDGAVDGSVPASAAATDLAGETGGAGEAGEVITDEERAERLGQLNSLIELMRPAVQADGGDLALVSADVVTGVVEVQLQGACSSCAVSASTLQGGVDRILRDRLAWVTEVQGGVDESVDPFESESMGRGGYVPSF